MPVSLDFGGFIPENDYSCFMPNASVLFNINATNPYSHFDLKFMGNYTLYNPNDPINLTIAAPFSSVIFGSNTNCTIKINDSLIPYEIIEYQWNETYSWDEYIDMYERNLVVCNITVPMNKSILLEYEFHTYLQSPLNETSLRFEYDFGTAIVWNGTVSERIEFKVYGQQPNHYCSYYFLDFTLNRIDGGKSYIWELKNKDFPPGSSSVYISYKGKYDTMLGISIGDSYIVFLFLGIVSLIIIIHKRKKLKRSY